MGYSVILPTFNENNHIKDLIKSISDIFFSQNILFEILVVDDNSTDGTRETVYAFSKINKFVKIIDRKFKKKNLADSIDEGIKKSNYDFIIWMDADFQHPPKYILEFLKLSKHHNAIICSRFLSESKRYFNDEKINKKINENQSYFYNKLCNFFLFKDLTDYTSGFICLKKQLLNNYSLRGYYGDYFVNLIVHLKLKGVNIIEIPFKDGLRASGFSKTVVRVDPRYLYLCLRYFFVLARNIFFKFI
jgi:dolichol-phosphate mannosyltransferase